ncbi:pumilio homolog 23 [Euphorbia lathyris]|uniref:pumilio homolog 23 n=1 Tax=Euphorbia lathyris TaxID=212925 RepID=UPI0033137096
MSEEDKSYKQGRRKKGMGRKSKQDSYGFDGDYSKKNSSGAGSMVDQTSRPRKSFKQQNASEPQTSFIRKQVDPETAKYFTEISNLFESSGVDLDERAVICANALEEARGKEFELATDYIISHIMQTLLEGCDADHLCGFLRSCAQIFPSIAMDRSGSHVAETALKSLAMHLQDDEAYSLIEETLTVICKAIVSNPVDMMCNCYGSHVLRSLLCLCGGMPLDSPELHGAKAPTVLAARLNLTETRVGWNDSINYQQGFPNLLKFLVSEMLKCTSEDIKALQVDQYSSLVLQASLKLLAGQEEVLMQTIGSLLGCKEENLTEENIINSVKVVKIVELMKETAYSHLMEVILGVSPESLYNEMFKKVFRNSLFKLSSHQCGNFVIQALVSHAKTQEQMEMIWEELGPKFKDLLELGRSGVIASVIAAIQRLHTHEPKCSQALAAAVCSPNESPRFIVHRILFLESYFSSADKTNWSWPSGIKMHLMGSLILQAIFKFQSEHIQPFINSLISMEVDHVLQTAKDAGGARVIEAFLASNASMKQKSRLIVKLRGRFGEIAMNSSGSFTIEKCFTACNLSLRESIASDLLAVQTELSKTKQGPYILRKLDIDRFARQPDQWRSMQSSKQSAYKDFYATFGSSKTKSSASESFLSDTSKNTTNPTDLKKMREEIDHQIASEKYAKKSNTGFKAAEKSKKATENTNQVPFLSGDMKSKKRDRKDKPAKDSKKKLKI